MCRARSHSYKGYLSCALRGRIAAAPLNDPQLNENNGPVCSIFRAEIETFVDDKDAENTKRSAKE